MKKEPIKPTGEPSEVERNSSLSRDKFLLADEYIASCHRPLGRG